MRRGLWAHSLLNSSCSDSWAGTPALAAASLALYVNKLSSDAPFPFEFKLALSEGNKLNRAAPLPREEGKLIWVRALDRKERFVLLLELSMNGTRDSENDEVLAIELPLLSGESSVGMVGPQGARRIAMAKCWSGLWSVQLSALPATSTPAEYVQQRQAKISIKTVNQYSWHRNIIDDATRYRSSAGAWTIDRWHNLYTAICFAMYRYLRKREREGGKD